ncbi:type I restriction endonuclease subunit R [Gaoshiqia sediminis]|uniref:Type I restriction endonuclease n=1 Tax=Gaoshiqia sediminis TaxID=2986998 RepID=A0AA42C6P2_9BACT|nr:type I restriction endonuclease [Gaoshiqia sediminis]MCW0482734.1 type I restriction endonuclease [Gaoshiqia sediminis]
MSKFTDTSEKAFQHLIVKHLVEQNGFRESRSTDFNKEFCINSEQLGEFIRTTQPETWEMIQRKGERAFLVRLDAKIAKLGVVEVLRKGVKHFDKTVDLFYRQPSSNYNAKGLRQYEANIFSVTQELIYSNDNANRLDLTIFLNGLPVITAELKNPLSGQTVYNAIRQYQNDRDPKDKIFAFARGMVHFAADTELVFMTSQLNKKNTFFLPFNKGLNDGKPIPPFGSGNPVNPEGLKTHYWWEEVLTKSSLANIIDKFAQVVDEEDEETKKVKRKMIFPRYHQLTAVRQILAHAKANGVGNRYLVQHSAGSGKSKSIAWLAHQLHGLYDTSGEVHLFNSVIVITDRIVLDKQLSDDIKQFAPKRGIVEHITGENGSKTSQLKEALANQKKVIVCTVQTFPFLLDEMADMPAMNFAIIIDEAHSGQSGQTASKMNAVLADKHTEEEAEEEKSLEDKINELIESRKMITNGSYFAFTATPKNKTLETFGIKSAETYTDEYGELKHKFYAFHVYSMKQAIEEEFIHDVLKNYTTYSSFYKLIKAVEDNPEFDTKQAQKKLRAYVEGHEFAIGEKAKIMIDHFHRDVKGLINSEAKAMIVTKSIECAIKYKLAFDEYLKEIKSPWKAIVAFSGKKTYNGVEYDEVSMNNFKNFRTNIPKNFKRNEYRFLIVAEKYQTGFDEPKLHTMYVDKKLAGVQTVQTLSRLNRAYKPHKKDTFVLDFFNEAEDIQKAFAPYYTATILSEETNPNKLNDLVDSLEEFEVYTEAQINDFFVKYIAGEDRTKLDPIIDRSAAFFKDELAKDQQIDFKARAKSFLRVYSYLGKILDFNNQSWEKLFWYLKLLVPKLYIEQTDDLAEGILESIDMESYRPSKQTTQNIILAEEPGEVSPIPVEITGGTAEPVLDTLENILSAFNQRFGDIDWSDKDKVRKILTEQLPAEMKASKEIMDAIQHSDRQNAKISSDNKIEELMQQYLFTQTEIFKKFTTDKDFERRYKEYIFDMLIATKAGGDRIGL